jgi:FkbM family methyltransferase
VLWHADAVFSALSRSWRTWVYLLLTYVGARRLRALEERRFGRWIVDQLGVVVCGGAVRVGGSPPAFGLLLSTDHFAVDHAQAYGLVRGVIEPSVQEALRRHVKPGAVVFDVGANLGFFSILSARLAGPGGRVEAFEPVPASADAIRANAALNGLANVRVNEAAVSDHGGAMKLWLAPERSQAHLVDRGVRRDTDQAITVRLVALDDEIEEGRLPVPSVLKIDVEGSEIAVLAGLRRTLDAHDLVVICELHETNAEVLEVAAELGYLAENIDGTTSVGDAGPIHVLFRRAH